VLLGLVAVTVEAVRLFKQFQPRLSHYEKYIPRIGCSLVMMAVIIAVW